MSQDDWATKPYLKPLTLKKLTYNYVYEILNRYDFNRMKSAKVLGVSIRTMRNWIHRLRKEGYEIEEKIYQGKKEK